VLKQKKMCVNQAQIAEMPMIQPMITTKSRTRLPCLRRWPLVLW